MTFLLIKKRKF